MIDYANFRRAANTLETLKNAHIDSPGQMLWFTRKHCVPCSENRHTYFHTANSFPICRFEYCHWKRPHRPVGCDGISMNIPGRCPCATVCLRLFQLVNWQNIMLNVFYGVCSVSGNRTMARRCEAYLNFYANQEFRHCQCVAARKSLPRDWKWDAATKSVTIWIEQHIR